MSNNLSSTVRNDMAVIIDHEFSVGADDLWAILGTPDRVDWVPGVQSCSYDGEVRALDLPGAGAIKERILRHDNEARMLAYSCFESPGNLESHRAEMHVTATDTGCRLLWQATVEPVAIEPFIKGSMEGCILRLEAMLSD